jgi:hypothetical protein
MHRGTLGLGRASPIFFKNNHLSDTMKKAFFSLSLLLASLSLLTAQQRYLEPVFQPVNVQTVTYGSNFSIMPLVYDPMGGHSVRQPLMAQVYTPAGDPQRCRPLIIYLHTGSFLPFPANSACGGALNDSSNVEFATRLAKMGYVVAVADYRLGWFPVATTEAARRFGFINALYRSVQDVRSCVRFFRKDVAENDNQFGIDPERVVVWGQGTGGYISLAAAYLNTYPEIFATGDPNKFKIQGVFPMVTEAGNGDINGTSGPCVVTDPANPLLNPLGIYKKNDTLCVPNHVGYPSNVQLCVNLGGALADSNWLDKGEVPLVSYHVPSDGFAPCGTADIGGGAGPGFMPIVEVTGSCGLHGYVEKYGNNDVFKKIPSSTDLYDSIAKARNGGANGFFPFIGTPNKTPAPWEWTNYSGVPKPQFPGCNVNSISARAYIDTIIGYFAPRGYVALGLSSSSTACISSVTPFLGENSTTRLMLVPNPANGETVLSLSAGEQMQRLELFDPNGRLMRRIEALNTAVYTLQRAGLPSGVYFVKAYFEKGVLTQKVIFE